MAIDELTNSNLILDVSGCTWLEFDSWTCTGNKTIDGYTYSAGGTIKEYDYATSTTNEILITESGYAAKISSNSTSSLSKQRIDVSDIDYVKVESNYSVAYAEFGTVKLTSLKGY